MGRYELVAHLATGGMGQVYLARTSGIGGFVRHVVVKTLDLPGTDEDQAIAMFLDEARLLGLLHHQHIAPVYEVGKTDDGHFFLVMDYIHGYTAHDVWARTNVLGAALPIDFSLTVAAAAALGLHYAHTRRDAEGRSLRIVHRDVTLSNLMIGFDGAVKLIDFGIAKAANRSTQTQVGFIKGKVGYMAPEQLLGHAVDGRTDVFALGIVLYELTTMRRAFREDSDRATMERIRAGSYTAPSALNPDYPRELERIVTRALRVDPRERYPDAESMRREIDLLGHQLGLVLGDAAVLEVMGQLWEQRAEPWQRRRPVRQSTELEVPLEVIPSALLEEEHTSPTSQSKTQLRAATEAAELQLETPPHGLPKRPSMFSIEPTATNETPTPPGSEVDSLTILAAGRDAVAVAASRARSVAEVAIGVAETVSAAPALGSSGSSLPSVSALPDVEFPRSKAVPPPLPLPKGPISRASKAMPAAAPGLTARQRVLLWGGVGLAAIAAAAVLVIVLRGPGDTPSTASADSGSDRSAAAISAGSSAEKRPAPPPPEKRPEPPVFEFPPMLPPGTPLQLVVKTMPSDATILLDGKRLGRSPYIGTIEAASGIHQLKIRKKGYMPVTLDIELVNNVSREVMLQRVKE